MARAAPETVGGRTRHPARAVFVDDPTTRRMVLEHPSASWYRDQQPLDVLLESAPLVEILFVVGQYTMLSMVANVVEGDPGA